MEKTEMKITPQDIIDKEFRVKFRGFDMVEVDAFLEEVAETFFQLTEENTLLNEKVLSQQQELETLGTSLARNQVVDLPDELENILDELKQDTAAISSEIAALKQDRQIFDAIGAKLEKINNSVQESGAAIASRLQEELPADLADRLQEFTRNSTAMAAELAALKEDRQAFDSLRTSFLAAIEAAREAAASLGPRQGDAEIPADLQKTLENLQQKSDSVGTELAGLKQEIAGVTKIRDEIKGELKEQLDSHFKTIAAQISALTSASTSVASPYKGATAAPEKKEALLTAEIIEGHEAEEAATSLPDYRSDEEEAAEGDLEFLSEDDILDVDKLRGIFQSVLDEGPDEGHISREGDAASADLLFIDDDLMDDGHEPEVTFSLEEHVPAKNKNFREK